MYRLNSSTTAQRTIHFKITSLQYCYAIIGVETNTTTATSHNTDAVGLDYEQTFNLLMIRIKGPKYTEESLLTINHWQPSRYHKQYWKDMSMV